MTGETRTRGGEGDGEGEYEGGCEASAGAASVASRCNTCSNSDVSDIRCPDDPIGASEAMAKGPLDCVESRAPNRNAARQASRDRERRCREVM